MMSGSTINRIQEVVADYYNIKMSDLLSRRRTGNIAFPRQVAMFLSRELTDGTTPEIGKEFARDHTTVIYSYGTVCDMVDIYPALDKCIDYLTKQILGHEHEGSIPMPFLPFIHG